MYEDLAYLEDGEEEGVYEEELGGLMEDPFLFEDPEDPFLFEEEAGMYESWEDMESDGYYEADPFLGKWARKAGQFVKKAAKGPLGGMLKGLAKTAATAAGGAIGGPFGAKIASTIANRVIRESDMEGDMEAYETDPESDLEAMGANMEVFEEMKYLSALASEADNEEEVDQFIGGIAKLAGPLIKSLASESAAYEGEEGFFEGEEGYYESEDGYYESDQFLPLIGLAAKLLPKALPFVRKGIRALGRVMKSSPQRRKVIGATLPQLIAKTATSLARQAQAGKPITPQRVAGTMARQTAKAIVRPSSVSRGAQANREAAVQRVQAKGPVVRVPVRTPMGTRTRSLPVRPAVVRRAVQGPTLIGSPRIAGGPYRRRIVRPRYCVY